MASTITRTTWTNDSGTAVAPVGDGTVLNNAALQAIYDKIDQLLAGAAPYNPLILGGSLQADGQPRCWAINSTTQSVPDSAWTALTLDSEIFDVGSMHSTVTNKSRITIPTGQGGLYLVIAQAGFDLNATGIRQLAIRYNGASRLWSVTQAGHAVGADSQTLQASAIYSVSAADYFEAVAYQTSGGALNVGSGASQYAASLQVVRLW